MAFVHSRVLMLIFVSNYGLAVDYRRPRINYPSSSANLYYQKGSYVQIRCIAEGSPSPTYKWLENDLDLIPSTEVKIDQTTGTLEIKSFSLRHQTSYRCVASVPYGLTVSPNVDVQVSAMSPKIRLFQLPLDKFSSQAVIVKDVIENDYLVLPCRDRKTSVLPAVKYVWFETESMAVFSDAGGRRFVDQDGSLHFTYVLVGDGRYDGYSCGIPSPSERGKPMRIGAKYVIHVSASFNPQASPNTKPQFKYSNSPVHVTQNSAATLQCVFASPGLTKIYWLDDNGKASYVNPYKYNISEYGNQLTVYNVQESDERFYYCAATRNGLGLQASSPVFLNVTTPPVFISSLKDQVAIQNSNAQFACEARFVTGEVPASPPAWFINGRRMQMTYDRNKFQLSDNRKVLIVKYLQKPMDVMCIQCEVEGTVDTATASACLNVILPINIFIQPQAVQQIEYGTLIDLTVKATTDPSFFLNYRWHFPTTTYGEGNLPVYMSFNQQSQVAFINTSKVSFREFKSMGGLYKINVFHEHESRFVETQVQIIDTLPPTFTTGDTPEGDSDTTPPTSTDNDDELFFWLVFLLILIIVASAVITIIIYMLLRHKRKTAEERQQGVTVVAPEAEEAAIDQPKGGYTTSQEENIDEESSDYSDEVGSQV